jgi:pimeloyl-ACP methyl ester carboxylesterase
MANEVKWGGQWVGELKVAPEQSIEMVFNIERSGSGYNVLLDVPAQQAVGLKFNQVMVEQDKIDMKLKSDGIRIQGTISGNVIQGTYSQGAANFALELKRVLVQKYGRQLKPQEPTGERPYSEELVKFRNQSEGHFLQGSLTLPPEPVTHVAILISGSGPSTRDSDVYGHKFFLVVADQLTRQGIAVLRYDDRGVAMSGGDHASATSEDLATDANAAVNFLKSQARFKQAKIGFIGHSEGGLIGAIAASKNDQVDFHVSMAGLGTTGAQALIDQNDLIQQLSGISDQARLANNKQQSSIMQSIANGDSVSKMTNMLVDFGYSISEAANQSKMLSSNWMRYFVKVDPATYYRQLNIPILAVNGERDVQVIAAQNLKAIQSARLAQSEGLTEIKSYPELNHLFQPAITGLPNEYGAIKITCSTEVITDIANWIRKSNP